MDESYAERLSSLFVSALGDSSDIAPDEADSASFALFQDNTHDFLLGCATLMNVESSLPAVISYSLTFFSRALRPSTQPLDVIRRSWGELFTPAEQEFIRDRVFGSLQHPNRETRICASTSTVLLFSVDLEGSLQIFPFLYKMIATEEYEESFRYTAIMTLREIFEASIIPSLPFEPTKSYLVSHQQFFYSVLNQFGDYPPRFVREVILTLAALIPNTVEQFSARKEQRVLLGLIMRMLPFVTDLGVCESLFTLFQVELMTFYSQEIVYPQISEAVPTAVGFRFTF